MGEFFGNLPVAAFLVDPRLPAALACAMLAGVIRGFSGFGSALVYIPLMSTLFGPLIAAGSFVLIDLAVDTMLMPTIWRRVQWREVVPMAAGGIVAGQFGTVILRYADPVALRWAISVIVLAVIGVLVSGWRYTGRPILAVGIMVGVLSGLLGSSIQIAGPPVIVYWLGSKTETAIVRANFLGYFTLLSLGLFGTYLTRGVVTAETVTLALFTGPAQVFMTWLGTRLFHLASVNVYRTVSYAVIALVALFSMPALDPWLR